jgi:AraC-like DNA-binding protein
MAEAAREFGLTGQVPHFSADPFAYPALLESARRLHTAIQAHATPVELRLRFNDCLMRLLRTDRLAGQPQGLLPGKAIGRAAEYLRAHPGDRISLEALARLTGLSRFHVAHEFKRLLGVPPHTYHLLQRVALARRLLRDGSTLRDSARQTGFVDANHLARHFKRIVGVTPGAYAASRHRKRRNSD